MVAYSISVVLLVVASVVGYVLLREEMAMQKTLTKAYTEVIALHRNSNASVRIVMDLRDASMAEPQNPRLVELIRRRLTQNIEALNICKKGLIGILDELTSTSHGDEFNWISEKLFEPPDGLMRRYVDQMRGLNREWGNGGAEQIRPLIPVEAAGSKYGALSSIFEEAADQLVTAIYVHSNRVETFHKRLTQLTLSLFLLLSLLVVLPLWKRLIREHHHHERAHTQLQIFAHTDKETGLPNLDGFESHIVPKWIPQKTIHSHYLLLIRIRNLDDIYNLIGSEQILTLHQCICERLTSSCIGERKWARCSDSEYTTIVSEQMVAEAETWLEPLITCLSAPVTVAGILIRPNISMAASKLENLTNRSSSFLHEHQSNARMALRFFDSKAPDLPVYSVQVTEELARQNAQINAISSGVKNREFVPYYQIKIDAITGRISSAEALSRWLKSDGQIISPDDYIPAAEKSGHIVPITYQLLELVAIDVQKLSSINLSPGPVAINVNADVLQHKDFLEHAFNAQEALMAVNSDLQIEITENVALTNMSENVRHVLEQLGENGIQIAIDDFGTGYASLQTLIDVPFDVLKIDRSFVAPMSEAGAGSDVISAIISLNSKLGKRSIVEGVEHEWQWLQLMRMGADELQGFYFQKPASFEELGEWLKAEKEGYISRQDCRTLFLG